MIYDGEMTSARRDRGASLRRDSTSPAQHATLEKSSPLASLIKKERGADSPNEIKIAYALRIAYALMRSQTLF